jgi:hypothetical protein
MPMPMPPTVLVRAVRPQWRPRAPEGPPKAVSGASQPRGAESFREPPSLSRAEGRVGRRAGVR